MKYNRLERHQLKNSLLMIVRENYTSCSFDVPKLAVLTKFKERTLHRLCKKHLNTTPSNFICRFRIEEAKKLFIQGMKNERVSESVGYKTTSGFLIAFKKGTGHSPTYYREQSLKTGYQLTLENICSFVVYESGFELDVQAKENCKDRSSFYIPIEALREVYLSKDFGVMEFAELLGFPKRTLFRHCKKRLGVTPTNFIRRLKIEQAKKLLLKGMKTQNVAIDVGYVTTKAFSKAFRKETGINPNYFIKADSIEKKRSTLDKINSFFGYEIDPNLDKLVKRVLREELGILLPQRRTLEEALESSIHDHEILNLIVKYRRESGIQ